MPSLCSYQWSAVQDSCTVPVAVHSTEAYASLTLRWLVALKQHVRVVLKQTLSHINDTSRADFTKVVAVEGVSECS